VTPELVAIWAIVRKDIAVWIRQPAAIAATLLPALGLILVLYIGASAVGRNPVALVAEDDGPRAQELAAILEDSDAFNVTELSAAQASVALQSLQVAAVITIPANFDQAFDAGEPDPVQIQINNLNLDFTNDLRRSLPAAITDYYAQLPETANPIGVDVQETDLRQQDIGLLQFQLIPNLVLLLTIAGAVNAGLATAREWEDQTIKELLLAPIHRGTLIVAKLLAGWLTTLVIAAIVLAIGGVTGYLRPEGGAWLPALITILLLALASAAVGVAVGAAARRFQRVAALTIPLAFYLFFLSGGISVIAFLPPWVQTIAQFVPTYYGMHALQMAVFYNSTDDLGRDLTVLVATTLVMLGIAVVSLRRRLAA